MRKNYILFSFLLVIWSCSNKKPSHTELVERYYHAMHVSDFSQLRSLLADTLTVIEGDFVSLYSREDYAEYFRWDSIFQPSYTILELKEQDQNILGKVAMESKRLEFLKNNPLTCTFKISFSAGKMIKLETLAYEDANFELWEKRRDSLVNYTTLKHPELDGFINDLTMMGAINYRKAIEYYQAAH